MRMLVLDEVSMVGRQMMGRVDSCLRQAKPGGEHPNRPCLGGSASPSATSRSTTWRRTGRRPRTRTSPVRLSNAGLEVYRTFEDVVILTTCHPLMRIDAPRSPAKLEFNERAERFVHVLRHLRDLEWTADDYFWLCQRKVGRLNEGADRFVHVLRRLRDLEWTAEDYLSLIHI